MENKSNLHPFDPNCVCQLCAWHRKAINDDTRKPEPPPPVLLTEGEFNYMIAVQDARPRNFGKLNAFVCPGCKAIVVTIDRDNGTTPAFLRCVKCPQFRQVGKLKFPATAKYMISRQYDVPVGLGPEHATFEFYRPSYQFYRDIKHAATRFHIERGGLLLRKIGEILPVGFEAMK